MRPEDTVSPSRCPHVGGILISERRSAGPDSFRHEYISVCGRCGKFIISGYRDSGSFRIEFTLDTQEQLDAAALHLWRSDGRDRGRTVQLGQPIDEALLAELEGLRQIADCAADTITTIDAFPQATTSQAYHDACWRLMRTLQRHGYDTRPWNDLDWRGSLIAALERAGLGVGEDGEIRVRLPTDRPWQPASGPRVQVAEST